MPIRKQIGSDYEPATLSDLEQHQFLLFGYITYVLLIASSVGRSVWENLDLGREYRPHYVRSTDDLGVKILPQTSRLVNKN